MAEPEPEPTTFTLEGNYPNPFNGSTSIQYVLPEAADVTLVVYDILGREVRLLLQAREEAGRHIHRFTADGLASGVYLYVLRTGTHVGVGKMLLVH
ncbi:MAG: T9SS type A sorting domain-containing protein [Rhodothermales bacterium]